MLCLSLFTLRRDASPPVVSVEMLKSSTTKLVTYVEFLKAPSLSTLTHLYGWCSLFNVFKINQMIPTGDSLDSVGNTHIIIVLEQTTVII